MIRLRKASNTPTDPSPSVRHSSAIHQKQHTNQTEQRRIFSLFVRFCIICLIPAIYVGSVINLLYNEGSGEQASSQILQRPKTSSERSAAGLVVEQQTAKTDQEKIERSTAKSQQRIESEQQQYALDQDDRSEALRVQQYLLRTIGRKSLALTAYVEEPLPKTQHNNETRLPLRTQGPDKLHQYTYNSVTTCSNLQTRLPVSHSVELDNRFGPNVGRHMRSFYENRFELAKCCCPVDADPFLPWIHDVFPNHNATFLEFVAHNKRRCRTGPQEFMDDLSNLEPQVTIMQSVPVKRLTEQQVQSLAPPSLWANNYPPIDHDGISTRNSTQVRYRLASIEDADEDGRETRFICRFHTLKPMLDNRVEQVVLGETLSVYPYNYEHANYRKPRSKPMLTTPVDKDDKRGAHNEQVWNSILHFRCPIPTKLQSFIATGDAVVEDIPSLYVDLVPIRTRPRLTREGYFPQSLKTSTFDPQQEWGEAHVLPTVEASGRWANIPICQPPPVVSASTHVLQNEIREETTDNVSSNDKPHFLVGCVWASASFKTRGEGALVDTSTSERLLEWLTFHLYIAKFDHLYVYDNSEAFSNETSLAPVLNLFPSNRVTRIPWSHRVCNNNGPGVANVGERSSQYAAETSCRLRYGPSTEWMVFFDTDEYLIPQKSWNDLKQWLQSGIIAKDTHILSFFQTKASPNVDFMEPSLCDNKSGGKECLAKREDATFLETYDCESTPLPKPDWGWRAKKQIYKPWYVLNHYVHYSTVTRRLLDAPNEVSPPFTQRQPYERRVDELKEAFMLHTKTTAPLATKDWMEKCNVNYTPKRPQDNKCPVGIPWPLEQNEHHEGEHRSDGMKYNCYRHERVTELADRLKQLMKPLLERYSVHVRPSP